MIISLVSLASLFFEHHIGIYNAGQALGNNNRGML
jgi:hypothetical protein